MLNLGEHTVTMGLTGLNNRTGLRFLFRVAGMTSYQALTVCTCFKYRDMWVQLTDRLNLIPLFGTRISIFYIKNTVDTAVFTAQS